MRMWGSRRLSLTDIHQSYRYRYRSHLLKGSVSYIGSHVFEFGVSGLLWTLYIRYFIWFEVGED